MPAPFKAFCWISKRPATASYVWTSHTARSCSGLPWTPNCYFRPAQRPFARHVGHTWVTNILEALEQVPACAPEMPPY